MTFWDAVIIVGVVVLVVGVVEIFERWCGVMWPASGNRHLSARERELLSDSLREAAEAKERARLDRLFPPTAGPKGFERQGDRRAHVQQIRSRKVN